jgi:ribosome-associated heat shock protein Hsp15
MNEESLAKETMRLDKWLWCARFFKTRAQAATAINGSKIKLGNTIPKPSRAIQTGDQLNIRKGPYQFDITILKLSTHRRSAVEATLLYEESQKSIETRELLSTQLRTEGAMYPRTRGRPTKRDRREILRFTRRPKSEGI